MKIKVLIIDDSAIVRQTLAGKLGEYEDIEIVGTATDPYVGRDKIVQLKPDVITLDIEMPRMDGLTFLEKLMTYYPIPVVIVSSVTARDPQSALKALEIGAFDVVNKPGGSITVQEVVEDIAYKIRQAYKVRDSYLSRRKITGIALTAPVVRGGAENLAAVKTTDAVVTIGSSTGGTVALEYIFSYLPPFLPPILIVQHMPENYTFQFAARLNSISRLAVKESEDGEPVRMGTAYVARGNRHLTVIRRGAALYIKHLESDKVCYQRPAADVLFKSLAETTGANTLGLLLTGMGSDGAEGLLRLKENGAETIAQDEASSVVWGMPQAAIKLGAAGRILGLSDMPQAIVDFSMKRKDL
jgi:two-component system chemotaxis response regulator CheB